MQHAEVAELGRRTGLRIQGVLARAGSNPAFGTRFVLLILFFVLFQSLRLLLAAQAIILKDVKLATRDGGVEVLLELSGKCHLKYGFLPYSTGKGGKLYIDLYPCVLDSKAVFGSSSGVNGVEKVRVGQFNREVVRVVLHLEENLKKVRFNWEEGDLKGILDFDREKSPSISEISPQGEKVDPYEILKALGRSAGQYRGFPVSLNFSNAPVRDVFRLFSDLLDVNIAVDRDVHSRVTLRFKDVPWDQAFEAVLKAANLGMEVKKNLVYIFPVEKEKGNPHISWSSLISLEIKLIALGDMSPFFISQDVLSLQKVSEERLAESLGGQVLYTWKLQTVEGKEAYIEQRIGQVKPTESKGDIVLQLAFVPLILQDGNLMVKVDCKKVLYSKEHGYEGQILDVERVKSEIMLKEGETLVIGGIGRGTDTGKVMAVFVHLNCNKEG